MCVAYTVYTGLELGAEVGGDEVLTAAHHGHARLRVLVTDFT